VRKREWKALARRRRRELDALRAHFEELSGLSARVVNERDYARSQGETSAKLYASAQRELDDLRTEYERERTAHDSCESNALRLLTERNAARAEVVRVREDLSAELRDVRRDRDQAAAGFEGLNQELGLVNESWRAENAKLRSELATAHEALAMSRETCDDAHGDVDERLAVLGNMLATKENVIAELACNVTAATERIASLERSCETLTAERDTARYDADRYAEEAAYNKRRG
jgi:chromosome segregation ATPase